MATFKFKCPHCSAELEAENEWLGMESTCPNCNQHITISQKADVAPIIPSPQRKKGGKIRWIIASSVISLVLAIGILGYLIISKGKALDFRVVPISKDQRHSISANVPRIPDAEEFPFALGNSLAQCTNSYPMLRVLTKDETSIYQYEKFHFLFIDNKLSLVTSSDVDKEMALNFESKLKNKWGEPDNDDNEKLRWNFQNMIIDIESCKDDKYKVSISPPVAMSNEERHSLSVNVPRYPTVEELPFALGSSLEQCTRLYPKLTYVLTKEGLVFYRANNDYFVFSNNQLCYVILSRIDKIEAVCFGLKVKKKWGEPDRNHLTELFGVLRWDFKNMNIIIRPNEKEYDIIISKPGE